MCIRSFQPHSTKALLKKAKKRGREAILRVGFTGLTLLPFMMFLEDWDVADVDDESTVRGVRSYALDLVNAERLWVVLEEMVGQKFEYWMSEG